MKEIEADRTLSPEGKAEELRRLAHGSAEKAGSALDTARQRAGDVRQRLEAGSRGWAAPARRSRRNPD